MPYQTIPGTDIRYALLAFDQKGNERTDDPEGVAGKFSDRIAQDSSANPPTNIFFFSHGWKGDLDSAKDQYNRWIKAMNLLSADQQKMGPDFRPLWIGLHWPSQAWGQERFSGGGDSFGIAPGVSMDALKEQYAAEFGGSAEARQCLDVIFKEQRDNAGAMNMPPHVAEAYAKLANIVGFTGTGPGSAPEAEGVPFDPIAAFKIAATTANFAGGGLGALLSPLRQLTFWTMKFRARTIGEGGMHDFIARLQNALPKAHFHLMGHSFGCVVVSSILGGKGGTTPLPRAVDSLALVQGALSLWAYADHVKDKSSPGYFNAAFRRPAVSGPVIVTRSAKDAAVGGAYPAAVAMIASNPDFDITEGLLPKILPLYGGIGTFGIRNLANVTDLKMLPSSGDYAFERGRIYNLKGDEFIPSHSGIDGPEVAHAIWQAALFAVAPKVAGAA